MAHKEDHIAEKLEAAALVSTVDQQSLHRKQRTKQVTDDGDTMADGTGLGPTSFGRGTPVTADAIHVPHHLQTQTPKADAADKRNAAGRHALKCALQAVAGSSDRKSLQPALQKELEHRLRGETGADRDRHKDRLRDSFWQSCPDTSRERHGHQRDKDTHETLSHRREDSSQRQDMSSHRHHDKSSDRHHGNSANRHQDAVFLPGNLDTNKSDIKRHVHCDANGNKLSNKSQSQWGVTSKDYNRDRHLSDIGRSCFRQHDRKRSRSPHERSNDSRVHKNR